MCIYGYFKSSYCFLQYFFFLAFTFRINKHRLANTIKLKQNIFFFQISFALTAKNFFSMKKNNLYFFFISDKFMYIKYYFFISLHMYRKTRFFLAYSRNKIKCVLNRCNVYVLYFFFLTCCIFGIILMSFFVYYVYKFQVFGWISSYQFYPSAYEFQQVANRLN